MRKAILLRRETGDQGTFGSLYLDGIAEPFCVTLELPWRKNARGSSCVPAGKYLFKKRPDSPKHGSVYEEWDDPATPAREDVKDRDNCQVHAANLAGDAEKGYVAQLLGCIAPGKAVITFKAGHKPAGSKDQRGIAASRTALAELEAELAGELLELDIRWAAGVNPEEVA